MEDRFSIDVVHNNKEVIFDAHLVTIGYIPQFHILINGIEVVYEPDEERNYRAIVEPSKIALLKTTDQAEKLGEIENNCCFVIYK